MRAKCKLYKGELSRRRPFLRTLSTSTMALFDTKTVKINIVDNNKKKLYVTPACLRNSWTIPFVKTEYELLTNCFTRFDAIKLFPESTKNASLHE